MCRTSMSGRERESAMGLLSNSVMQFPGAFKVFSFFRRNEFPLPVALCIIFLLLFVSEGHLTMYKITSSALVHCPLSSPPHRLPPLFFPITFLNNCVYSSTNRTCQESVSTDVLL